MLLESIALGHLYIAHVPLVYVALCHLYIAHVLLVYILYCPVPLEQ